MKNLDFRNIPPEFEQMKISIKDEIIKKLYSNYIFEYFTNSSINPNVSYQENIIEKTLFDFLKDFKLIVYNFFNHKTGSLLKINEICNNPPHCVNIIICVESKCIVIEQISNQIISQVFEKIKLNGITMINIDPPSNTGFIKSEEELAKEEVESFCNYFQKEMKNNIFVSFTIKPIAGYSIRKYFYPTNYFKDQSFFTFGQNNIDIKENNAKKMISSLLLTDSEYNNYDFISMIFKCLSQSQTFLEENIINNRYQVQEFLEEDFILLRRVSINQEAYFYLVLHIKSFYIFMMKKLFYPHFISKEANHEIEFVSKHSHRCFVRFYGFVKKNKTITGFIYEFMSNGDLSTYVKSKKEKIHEMFSLLTINRIFHGIDYLHTNALIHRDLKPGNILLNHDFLPFISDFETIRNINGKQDKNNETITNKIGSILYSSPEQYYGSNVSFPTDIFSFGLIIYYLYEKCDVLENFSFVEQKNNELPAITHSSLNIQTLYQKCSKISQFERPTRNEIRSILINEANSIDYYFNYAMEKTNNILFFQIVDFILENIIIISQGKYDQLFLYLIVIYSFHHCFSTQKKSKSSFYNEIGLYLLLNNSINYFLSNNNDFLKSQFKHINNNFGDFNYFLYLVNNIWNCHDITKNAIIKRIISNITFKDFLTALKYYELSAQQGNSDAFLNIGDLHFYGCGIKQDYIKAKYYYELSAKQNNSIALLNLGYLYNDGYGVERDFSVAKYYYELSAQQGNSDAILKLGDLYFNGQGIKQDYSKAKYYYELSAKQNNSIALLNLGYLYNDGYGVERDFSVAKYYYELSAQQGNSDAILNLGNLYFNGQGIKQDYSKAKYYYELSALLGNSIAFKNIGNIYFNGNGIKQDYSIAKYYYELAAEQNNDDAQLNLGFIYYHGLGVKQDLVKAKYYFELSAHQNNSDALLNLGIFYENAITVKQDFAIARYYYELSAQQGNSDALLKLGILYHNGFGIKKDYLMAKYYYENSAKYGNSNALLELGNLYYIGQGIKQDYSKAKYYFELSAQQGNSDALLFLGDLYFYNKDNEKDYSKSIFYYELSAQKNNPFAQLMLGNIYYDGFGVKPDYAKSKYYYELSAKQNISTAFLQLGQYYEDGFDCKKDYSKARYYYELAAKNCPSANLYLGNLYFTGLGVMVKV